MRCGRSRRILPPSINSCGPCGMRDRFIGMPNLCRNTQLTAFLEEQISFSTAEWCANN